MLNYQGYGLSQNFTIAKDGFPEPLTKPEGHLIYNVGLIFYNGDSAAKNPEKERARIHFRDGSKAGDAKVNICIRICY